LEFLQQASYFILVIFLCDKGSSINNTITIINLGMEKRRELFVVFLISSILVLAGFSANEKAYAGESFPPFGDFKCWQNITAGPTPPAILGIQDQFGSTENSQWFSGDYCTAATKILDEGNGQGFPSPFEPALNQHYQAWFYPPSMPGPGTDAIVNLEIPQFDNLNGIVIGNLDSILVPATKILPTVGPVPSQDFAQHWNCYDLEFVNDLFPPDVANVELTTQHGPQIATVLEPFLFCAPMIKFDGNNFFPENQVLIDDHMVCYDLTIQDELIVVPLPLALEDQLTVVPQTFVKGTEEILCVPAIKSFPVVGGSMVPIDQSALLLAGVQSISMWMIPVVIAGIGIGIFVIKRRN